MALDIIFFRKKKSKLLHTFALLSFFSTCYLISLINGSIVHYRYGAIEYILRAKIWLDGFDRVFWQISIEIFLLFFVVLFSRFI